MEKVLFIKGETEENWSELREEVNNADKETISEMKRHHQDQFDENDYKFENQADKESTRKHFSETQRILQKSLRQLKDEWWKRNAEEIQLYADSNDAKMFYSSLREVYGPP